MKFLFLYPLSGKKELASKKSIAIGPYLPPLGILYLAKILENNGHVTEVIDFNAENINEESLKQKILTSDAVGMTIYSGPIQLNNSITLSNMVKNYDPDIPIIIGGPHSSLYPEKALLDHHAKVNVVTEGEPVIIPIVEAIQGKRKLSSIPNIWYKENGTVKKTKPAEKLADLDGIPFPARHLVDKYEYGWYNGVKLARGKLASLLTSRGCPYNCTFCGLHTHIPGYRKRSIKNIIDELEEVLNAGYKTLVFSDDNFLIQRKQVEAIMDFLIQDDRKVDIWIAEARVDSAERKLFEKLRDAGVEIISFGIESGNQDVLDFYNKGITLSQIRNAVNLSKEMGFFINASFIFGAPIETEKHFNNTIEFAKSIPLDSVSFFNLGYGNKSPLWKKAVQEGKIRPDEVSVKADSRRGLSNFTEEELLNWTLEAYKRYYFNPRLWIRQLLFAISKRDFRFVKMGFKSISF